MSKFYILPPRPAAGRRFAEFLNTVFPGLDWDASIWSDLADALAEAAGSHPDVFVVHREDLDGGGVSSTLIQSFGADAGDEVIEFLPGQPVPQCWRIGRPSKGLAA